MKNKTIEEKMNELNSLLSWFDGEEFVLEQAIDKYKEAEKLADDIKQSLRAVQNEINIISQNFSRDTE